MSSDRKSNHYTRPGYRSLLFLLVVAALTVTLAGCGSTSVYTADKTILYKSAIYNMANVQRIAPSIKGELPDGSTVDMGMMDKKAVESLLKQFSSVTVTTSVEMDQQSMVYQRATVKRYSDFNKLARNLGGAMNDINKFMANSKKTQLKLK